MNVPVYNKQISIQAPGVPTPRIAPITEATSGVNMAEAQAGLGKTVSNLAGTLAEHLIAKQEHEQEQAVNDKVTEFSKEASESILYGKDGAFNVNGANAKGITPVYDQRVNDLKAKYVKDLPPKSAELFNRIADTHANLWRNNVIKHEIDQTNIADEQATASNIVTSAQTYGASFGVKATGEAQSKHDADMDLLLGKARSEVVDLMKRKGITDDKSILLEVQKVDGQFAIEAAKANPVNADIILDSGKFNLSARDKAQLHGIQVDGLQNTISQAALTYKTNSDGTPNLASTIDFATSQAKAHKFTPEQTEQVVKYAHSQVAVATAEIRQNREQNQSKFYNQAIQMYNSGKKQPEIIDALVKKSNYDFSGYSATDKAEQKAYIDKMFINADEARGTALAYISKEQKMALEEAKIIISGAVGKTKIKLAGSKEEQDADKVYESVLNKKVAGSNMTYDEIIGYAKDLSKNIEMPSRFWGTTSVPAYKAIKEQDIATSISISELEKAYGRSIVNQAISVLGPNASPATIQQAIDLAIPKKAKVQEPMQTKYKAQSTGPTIEMRAE